MSRIFTSVATSTRAGPRRDAEADRTFSRTGFLAQVPVDALGGHPFIWSRPASRSVMFLVLQKAMARS